MTNKANIWHHNEVPGYDRNKSNIGFNRWRILILERVAQITLLGQDDAVARLHDYGLEQLGCDYDDQVTAEEISQKLAHDEEYHSIPGHA